MDKNIINFLNDHEDEINNNEWFDLFEAVWHNMSSKNAHIIVDMLSEIEDPQTIELASILGCFKWRVEYELESNIWGDMANSWSRLNWMIDAMPMYNRTWHEIRDAVFAEKEWLGVTLKPLDLDYSWNGSPEYDLGWFRPEYYSEEG